MTGSEMWKFSISFLGSFAATVGILFCIIGSIWPIKELFYIAASFFIFAGLCYLMFEYVKYSDRRDAKWRKEEMENEKKNEDEE